MLVSVKMGDEEKGNRKRPPALKTTVHQINPGVGTHPLYLLLSLHHPQCLVQNHLARLTIIHHFDNLLHHGETTYVGISDEGDAPAADEDAASEGVRNVVIPEREVGLAMCLRLKMGWLGGPPAKAQPTCSCGQCCAWQVRVLVFVF